MIEHRPDRPSPWRARVRAPDGRLVSKSFRRKEDAIAWEQSQRTDMRRGEWVDPTAGDLTLTAWLVQLEARKRIKLAESTLENRKHLIRSYVDPYIGLYPLNRITTETLEQWIADLHNHVGVISRRALSPATIRKTYVIVAEALKLAVARGRLARDPNVDVELPAVGKPEHRYLSEGEVWQLADAIGPRYRPFVLIGAFAGLRPGEIRTAQWSDLNGSRLLVRGTKTERALRTVKLSPPLMDELEKHRRAFPSAGFIVHREDGTAVDLRNLRNRRFKTAVRKTVGEPMRLHDLRHTHVAILIAHGAHPHVIAERLGDSIKTTFDTYGHILEGVEDAAVDRIGRRDADVLPFRVSPNDPQAGDGTG